jgi:hypothetical protein
MQFEQPYRLGEIEPAGDVGGDLGPSPGIDPSHCATAIPYEALSLLEPDRDRVRAVGMAAGALLIGLGLGWAVDSTWPGAWPSTAAPHTVADKMAVSPPSEMRPANRIESVRRQSPPALGGGNSPKTQPVPAATARVEGDAARLAAAALANIPTTGSIAPREPLAPAPETRPTTIEGWTVREVRGGTAVLEGPDGIRTVTAGDSVPGLGHIDSVVRWGNRWIVATASGLIATP